MGERLSRLQARAVAQGRSLHERVRVQVHRIQRRPASVPGKGFCLLSDEIRCGLHSLSVPCQGGREPPDRPEDRLDHVHEIRAQGEPPQKRRRNASRNIEGAQKGLMLIRVIVYT